ncbi:hypothetical protein AUJ95_05285 [Candidatus Desantisbacteria bacterium CG2_30_40_21]|uniref:TolC family protein n=4 Tax=unclassified Candidatus Desantisiibacteriota TaxID=3106372 RepID=A0A2M7JDP7_9BACT|nr:MAG: hypothetical protein AUJ95_05285 [Candidatus Desantisbacteria bacterium CG2_30_40_21]PIP42406.1 MAG: hypothetical protein COX18_00465 [Candidatus Desantisbacteria bacterium CG23_combo_of_CG06-09_8_20_14_all_40_23]PIX17535.1 MAG: hypothetical protein COZ71_02820 [Candidatus Desantisbacteria bacterium CG_4_8_14_3_um_filter_40_12]PIY18765.1 MAG: hypothetical protein COZ13_08855 [Candidatus Desantisbacteria bacterium CG_4_10_14_3_um_filter_40_18]
MKKTKMRKICWLIVIIIIASLKDVSATDLAGLIDLSKQHPEILKVRERLTAQKAKIEKVQVIPDPMIGVGLGKTEGMTEGSLMFQQAFPYPGKLSLMGEKEKRQLKMLETELSAITLEKIAQTKKDYYELFWVNKSIEITNRTKEHLKHIEGIANAMYATGMIPQTDILRIQTEISMQTERLIMLEAKKEQASYHLLWFSTGISPEKDTIPIDMPAELTLLESREYAELQRIALENSPMLKMVEYQTQMGEKEVELAKKEFKPDFVSQAELMISGNWSVRLGIMYPLYKDKKQKNALLEIEANLSATKKEYEQKKLELLLMLKESHLMAKSTLTNLNLYKTAIIPQLNLTYTSALSNYKTGKIDFLMMFDTIMRLQEGELRYYELLTEYGKAMAEIERLTGGGL